MVLTHSATVGHTTAPRTFRCMCFMQNAGAVSTASIDTGRWHRDCRTRHGATGSKETRSYEPQVNVDRSFRVSKKSCVRCRHMYTYEHACNCEQHGRCFLDTHAGSGTSCDYTIKIKMFRAYKRPSTVQRMHTTALTTSCPSWGASYDSVVFLSRTLTERHSRNPSPRWPFGMIA